MGTRDVKLATLWRGTCFEFTSSCLTADRPTHFGAERTNRLLKP